METGAVGVLCCGLVSVLYCGLPLVRKRGQSVIFDFFFVAVSKQVADHVHAVVDKVFVVVKLGKIGRFVGLSGLFEIH